MQSLASQPLVALSVFVGLAAFATPAVNTANVSSQTKPVCNSLSMRLSDDKNYYTFTATSSTPPDSITGYTFHFGDRESYQLVFKPSDHLQHQTATVTHTYRTAGTYTASVQVNAPGGQASSSNPACQVRVAIPPAGTVLPNTGAGNMFGIATAIASVTTLAHWLYYRRRQQR